MHKTRRLILWKRLSSTVAALCLTVSFVSMADQTIADYNNEVAREQIEKHAIANDKPTFSFCNLGIDYSKRNRLFIFFLCIAGFISSRSRRYVPLSLFAYSLTFMLAYQWVAFVVRALSLNLLYMADTPYLLRIASVPDWATFAILPIAFAFNYIFAIKDLEWRR